jgi:amino acid transporter
VEPKSKIFGFTFFQKVNKSNVPTRLLLFQAIIVSVAGFVFLYMPNVSGAFWILTALSAQSYLIMYILMFLSAIILRYTKPQVPRAYKVPFKNKGIWLFGSLGIITSLFVIALAFVPPAQINTGSPLIYCIFLVSGLIFMCGVPFWIYAYRKPNWVQKKH